MTIHEITNSHEAAAHAYGYAIALKVLRDQGHISDAPADLDAQILDLREKFYSTMSPAQARALRKALRNEAAVHEKIAARLQAKQKAQG